MAFLDNSGDIILDAVLTDTGRYRLAKGDGSFKITKFALGDDEINYGSYNKNHPSGSAYYDLEILQTPVLEAFTNNTSTMKSKLISIARTNLLYLPEILINDRIEMYKQSGSDGTYQVSAVAVDSNTVEGTGPTGTDAGFLTNNAGAASSNSTGILNGFDPSQGNNAIRVDQGLATNEIPNSNTIDAELNETQYIVEMDNRLGSLVDVHNGNPGAISFIDDDNIASYYFSAGTDTGWVGNIATGAPANLTPILGPAGSYLHFKIRASTELQTSTYLFEKLGTTGTMINQAGSAADIRYIDTIMKITGATTGYSIDVAVRYIKKN
tara:strand:- start:866 stop:1837 length:972 start_codon:yes stop_codon:yes gene_type:complete